MQYDKTWKGHKFVISTFGIPEEAFTIHGYVPDIPIDDFKDENGLIINNAARTVDVPDSEIAKWTRIHENENYDDTINFPVFIKPDKGAGSVDSYKINDQ